MWHSHCTPIKSRLRAWKWERSEKDSKIKAMADGKTKAGDSSSSGTAKPTREGAWPPFLFNVGVRAGSDKNDI